MVEASWDRVISVHELVRLDVPERTAYRRTAEDGPWQLLLPATILLSNGEPTFRQWQIAALLHAGPDAVLTGLGGAQLHGLRRGGEPEKHHVLIPATRNVKSCGPVIVERTRRPVKRLERDGLPVAPISRCLLDHVRRTKDEEQIAALLTEPVQRRMVPKEMLVAELETGTRKGSAAPRRVLRAVSAGVESPTEFQYYRFWNSLSGLPTIRCNVPVYDLDGTRLGIVDFLADELGFAWESDSVEEHFATPEQVQRTAERARRLRGAGLYVLSTRPHQLRDDPRGVETDIRQGLEIAAAMPPPRVTYGPPHAA
ncbi:hypothetical protein HH311_04795 [Actinomycetospora sp. TBRC 11914]|nr:hypothetical protein [Actinomycetospora sp. TBRC 11914]